MVDLLGVVFAVEVPVFSSASGASATRVGADIGGDDVGCKEAIGEASRSCHDGGEMLFPNAHLVVDGKWSLGMRAAEVEILDMFPKPSRVGGEKGGVGIDDVGRP